jgi:7-carboxy-7-deazaguanine synthase
MITQIAEPTTIPGELTLPVMEAFYTLQGEGFHQGRAAYFIRLGGCDIGCTWCDVKESWPLEAHPLQTIPEIVRKASGHPTRMAVITGGEPLLHPLGPLTQALREAGMRTHLETSGAYPLSGTWDWICVSPKKFRAPLDSVCGQAHELKVIIYHRSDLQWAEQYAATVSPECRCYLQPEWSRVEKNIPFVVAYIQQHPRWTISLQLHKYIGVP